MAMTAVMLSACGERTDIAGEAVIVRDNENRTGCVEGMYLYRMYLLRYSADRQ